MARRCRLLAQGVVALSILGCSDPGDGSDTGASRADPSELACGELTCLGNVEYCQQQVSDLGGIPDTFVCVPMPPTCPTPGTCACLKEARVICSEFGLCLDSEGGPTMVCPGG